MNKIYLGSIYCKIEGKVVGSVPPMLDGVGTVSRCSSVPPMTRRGRDYQIECWGKVPR